MCAKDVQKVPQYLYRPDNGRTFNWYVRLVPPKALKHLRSVKEYRQSTGTADLGKAKIIGANLIAQKRIEWDKLANHVEGEMRPQLLTNELIDYICSHRLYEVLDNDDSIRIEGDGYTSFTVQKWKHVAQLDIDYSRSVLSQGKASEHWLAAQNLVETWCRHRSIVFSRTDPLYARLVHKFTEVEVKAKTAFFSRLDGNSVDTPRKPEHLTILLSEMTKVYQDYKKQKSGQKHSGSSVHVWLKLIEHMGDVPLSMVAADDLYGFLDARMRAPIKPWSMGHAHGFVRRTLREVFALARTKGLLKKPNPVDELELMPMLTAKEESSRKKPRLPFSDTQLSTLFSSAWYQKDASNWSGKMAKDLGARYWVPLICLTHGNRVTEVLQLIASDVSDEEGISVIHFRTDVEGGQGELEAAGVARSLKNGATERVVPLHPLLLKMGFLEFVRERQIDGGANALLFPSSLPEKGGKSPLIGRAYEQAFLRFVRDKLEFGKGFGNHSFRHQLEDRIRDAQVPGQIWPAGLALAYTGRSRVRDEDIGLIKREGSASVYGRGHRPSTMLDYVQALSFEGVRLPPPYKNWLDGASSVAPKASKAGKTTTT